MLNWAKVYPTGKVLYVYRPINKMVVCDETSALISSKNHGFAGTLLKTTGLERYIEKPRFFFTEESKVPYRSLPFKIL